MSHVRWFSAKSAKSYLLIFPRVIFESGTATAKDHGYFATIKVVVVALDDIGNSFALGLFDHWHVFSSSCFGHQIFLSLGLSDGQKKPNIKMNVINVVLFHQIVHFHHTNMSEHHICCIFHTDAPTRDTKTIQLHLTRNTCVHTHSHSKNVHSAEELFGFERMTAQSMGAQQIATTLGLPLSPTKRWLPMLRSESEMVPRSVGRSRGAKAGLCIVSIRFVPMSRSVRDVVRSFIGFNVVGHVISVFVPHQR